jgi:hypothetical protein
MRWVSIASGPSDTWRLAKSALVGSKLSVLTTGCAFAIGCAISRLAGIPGIDCPLSICAVGRALIAAKVGFNRRINGELFDRRFTARWPTTRAGGELIAREPALTGARAILRGIGAFGCALLAWDLPFTDPGEAFWPNAAFVCASTGGVTIASAEIKQNAKIVSRSIGLLRRLNIINGSLLQSFR